ncbi:MAG: nitrogenase cofactor biosynthesis protein NifB [Magnetococcus sp. THC-1_WYH]
MLRERGETTNRVDTHPCFSKEAHRHARMHLAVAPACNIQCHYCNRKYDCSNESRPGVVSELMTPDEVVGRVAAVRRKIPQLTVVGIAGPGDPLANPGRTFETCRRLSAAFPNLMLCLSTNGLELSRYANTIARLGIHHVTMTLNAVDPAIGAQIYPWIFWKHQRIRGIEAAKILMEQQLEGLHKLATMDVLVKINSVLIPGVNDTHMKAVHQVIAGYGVFLHNIMPLIAEPEHGTYYGLMGQRVPTSHELAQVRSQCGDVSLMTHCRQCRADAVGLLHEDRGEEFTRSFQSRVIPIQVPVARREDEPCLFTLPKPALVAGPVSKYAPIRPSR